MIAGYHLIWTAYGWWLPNDPRGSSSTTIRSTDIKGLGPLHVGRRQVQPSGKAIREFYANAQQRLKHELLTFSAREITAIAHSFATAIQDQRYTCYAAAIMPDHVHIVVRKHRDSAEIVAKCLQDVSCDAVLALGERPIVHPVWGGPGWRVFLESRDDFERTIRYVEENPAKARLPDQTWPFVTRYDGWVPGGATVSARNRKRGADR
jgi:REP element-mobilizing transposase RayT